MSALAKPAGARAPSYLTIYTDVFEVGTLERATQADVVFGSKAVGEPPLMLAISVREAIREAAAAFGHGSFVSLASPATPERVFFAVAQARAVRAALR